MERAYHYFSSIPLAEPKQSQLGLKLCFSFDYRHFCHFHSKFSGPDQVSVPRWWQKKEEVAVLKRTMGLVVGGSDNLVSDSLNSRMEVRRGTSEYFRGQSRRLWLEGMRAEAFELDEPNRQS